MTDWWAFTLFAAVVGGAGLTSVISASITEWRSRKEEVKS